ncbi:MAG: hypothetical protein ACYSTI_14220, partial [Planctomycetota bacterium]
VSAKPKEGDTRQFRRGTKTITQEYRGGKWTKLAEGEAFSPKEGKTAYEKDEAKLMDDYRSLASLEKSIQMKGLDDPMVQMALALNPSLAEGMEAKDVSEVLTDIQEQRKYIGGLLGDIRLKRHGVKMDEFGNLYLMDKGKKHFVVPSQTGE